MQPIAAHFPGAGVTQTGYGNPYQQHPHHYQQHPYDQQQQHQHQKQHQQHQQQHQQHQQEHRQQQKQQQQQQQHQQQKHQQQPTQQHKVFGDGKGKRQPHPSHPSWEIKGHARPTQQQSHGHDQDKGDSPATRLGDDQHSGTTTQSQQPPQAGSRNEQQKTDSVPLTKETKKDGGQVIRIEVLKNPHEKKDPPDAATMERSSLAKHPQGNLKDDPKTSTQPSPTADQPAPDEVKIERDDASNKKGHGGQDPSTQQKDAEKSCSKHQDVDTKTDKQKDLPADGDTSNSDIPTEMDTEEDQPNSICSPPPDDLVEAMEDSVNTAEVKGEYVFLLQVFFLCFLLLRVK